LKRLVARARTIFLNRLTEKATGLKVFRGSAESSTVGNFAVQLAVLQGRGDAVTGADAEQVSQWAALFVASMEQPQRITSPA
jgi:rhamnulokinase